MKHPKKVTAVIRDNRKMSEHYRDILRVLLTLVYMYIVIKVLFPVVNAAPVGNPDPPLNNTTPQDPAEDRMFKPPRFPYGGPFGFYSSGLLCIFDTVPYVGGWFGRSCAGPIAPFAQPTPPSTTTIAPTTTTTTEVPSTAQPVSYYYTPEQLEWLYALYGYNGYNHQNQNGYGTQQVPDEDYGEPIEGNPWEPDDDDIFIESYGQSASKPGFKMGDPNRHR